MLGVTLDVLVRVAKAIAAADRKLPGRDDEVWSTLSIDEQAFYTMQARVAVEAYLAAIADARV